MPNEKVEELWDDISSDTESDDINDGQHYIVSKEHFVKAVTELPASKDAEIAELKKLNDHPLAVMKEISDKHPINSFDSVQYQYTMQLEIKYNTEKVKYESLKKKYDGLVDGIISLPNKTLDDGSFVGIYIASDVLSLIRKFSNDK